MPIKINKLLFVLLLVIVAMILVLLFWQFPARPETGTVTKSPQLSDEEALVQEVNSIQISDLESDFREIDTDLNSL